MFLCSFESLSEWETGSGLSGWASTCSSRAWSIRCPILVLCCVWFVRIIVVVFQSRSCSSMSFGCGDVSLRL